MNKSLLTLSIAALLLTVSCNRTGDPQSDQRVAVRFSAAIDMTRAVETSWESGDAIGIFMKHTGETLSAQSVVDRFSNCLYTTSGDGNFGADDSNTIYYPTSGADVDFVAYYPYTASVGSYAVALNVEDQSKQSNLDVLYSDNAVAKSKDTPEASLKFNHRMSKVVVYLFAGEGMEESWLAKSKVTLWSQPVAGSMSLVDGAITTSGNAKNLVLLSGGSVAACDGQMTKYKGRNCIKHEAIVMPHTTAAGSVASIVTDGVDAPFSWALNADKQFKSGEKSIFYVTLDRVEVSFDAEIVAWGDGGEGEGVAIPQ